MRFLFVDRITSLGEGDNPTIKGQKVFPLGDPMRYAATVDAQDSGSGVIAGGVISEAIGQLASWYCLKQNDFSARPVFLFADKIRMLREVHAGSTVDLSAEIHRLDSETFTFSGRASVGDSVVQEIKECSGWLMPLDQLEDPVETRRRFAALVDGGLPPESSTGTFAQDDLLDEIMDCDGHGSINVRKTMAPDSPWYPDHFPRFPVTPIVVLNEVIAAASSRLLRSRHGARVARVEARGASGIKIKSFVRPGETCDVKVSLVSETEREQSVLVETVAELTRGGKKLLRGHYSWEVIRA